MSSLNLVIIFLFLLFLTIHSFQLQLSPKNNRLLSTRQKDQKINGDKGLKNNKSKNLKHVPFNIKRPDYALSGNPHPAPNKILVLSKNEIEIAKIAGVFAREVLDKAIQFVKPGISTEQIDLLVHEETIKRNCYPSTLNYHKYPKSCCTSKNQVICHGIPDEETILKDGDIINIDVTLFYEGIHSDCSETVLVGNSCSEDIQTLVKVTYDAWNEAIKLCKPGVDYSKIGAKIENVIKPYGYSSVKDFCGHGVGPYFHSLPNILHYKNTDNYGPMMPGHCFTIEPLINMGKEAYVTWPNKWTVATQDGLPSAQFENTLLITEDGAIQLTGKISSSQKYFWEQN